MCPPPVSEPEVIVDKSGRVLAAAREAELRPEGGGQVEVWTDLVLKEQLTVSYSNSGEQGFPSTPWEGSG